MKLNPVNKKDFIVMTLDMAIGNLQAVSQVVEKVMEYQIDVSFVFVVYYKAFDSVEHRSMQDNLRTRGLEPGI